MKTLKRIVPALILIIAPFFALAQNGNDTAKINFIKSQFSDINQTLKMYKKVVKKDEQESGEEDDVLEYFSGGEIKKISTVNYGERGKELDEYYFNGSKLIFFYSKEDRYTVPISVNPSGKIASSKEKRYYFSDDKIIMVKLSPSKATPLAQYKKLSLETQKEAKRLIDLK